MPTHHSKLTLTIGGELSPNNNASLKTIATVTSNIQLALNRAYLDIKTNGNVQKNERVKNEDLSNIDFWLESRKAGSLVIDFISTTEWGEKIADRFSNLVLPAFNLISQGIEKELYTHKEALTTARNNLKSQNITKTINELRANPPVGYSNSYAQKSTLRFLSSSISPIRNQNLDGTIGIKTTTGQGTHEFTFDKIKAASLQRFVSNSSYLQPVIYHGEIIANNKKLRNGTFINIDGTKREQRLLFNDDGDFEIANAIYAKGDLIKFYGMPRVESSSLDLQSGDILFVGLAHDR
jgi:hypothetical protein